uniref:NADH-ubiquinone oxidoreductase chain 1 n=1 Tax=Gruberia lanceolata TaxID=1978530 RepID=A0A6C0UAD7_9CILI|nr:NADH dehydrogenase subunit 1 [Gruberia lanceolata]
MLSLKMFTLILFFFFIKCIISFEFICGLIYVWLSFLFIFLQVVFFTTCERKILALTQRRLGPRVVGERGRLQFIADALKLVAKLYVGPRKVNSLFFQNSAVAAFWLSWYGFANLTFGVGEDIMEIEYNLFFLICVSLAFSIVWLVSGWASVSKYALLGCIRAVIQVISYEVIMGGVLLNLLIITGTTNYEMIMEQQEYSAVIIFAPMLGIVTFLATLMETNRAPFDLSEAESDVVAGYAVEYAGILFGLFYLGEYLNLFTNSFVLTIIFFGSWWNVYIYFDHILNIFKYFFFYCELKYSLLLM